MADSSRFEKTVTRMLIGAARRRRCWRWVLAALLVLAALVLCRAHYGADVTALLPPDSDSARGFELLRKSGLAESVRIEFLIPAGVETAIVRLDQTAMQLRALPGVRRVEFRYGGMNYSAGIAELARRMPEWSDPAIVEQSDPDAMAAALRKLLLAPGGGSGMTVMLDWTGSTRAMLGALDRLRRRSGLDSNPAYPFMVDRDGKRALMQLELAAFCADTARSRAVLGGIQAVLQSLPPEITARILAPHWHALANETIMKRDIVLASWSSLLLLGMVFLAVYRGHCSSLWIPLLPLPAAALALAVTALFQQELYYFVVGMGGGIVGVAVDQGIHVYVANHGTMGLRRVGRLIRALLTGCLTSAGVFWLLLFTDIPGYRQLGYFAGGALVASLLLMLLVLPGLMRKKDAPVIRAGRWELAPRWHRLVLLLWILLMLPALWVWRGLPFKADMEEFDGTPEAILAEERDFAAAWRTGLNPALLLAEGASEDEVLARTRELARLLTAEGIPALGAGSFYPERAERLRRCAQWRQLAETGALETLRERWREALVRRGLPEGLGGEMISGWQSSWSRTGDGPVPELLQPVLERLVRRGDDGGWLGLVLFEDKPGDVAEVQTLIREMPGVGVVSQSGFGALLAADFAARIPGLLAVAVGGVILAAWLFFRSLKLMLLALVPVATAAGILILLLWASGMALNLIVCFAGVILAGLTIDYGVFAVSALQRPEMAASLRSAMVVSAVTTVAGTGPLLLTSHPILFQSGVMLCTGIAAAAAGALLVVPALAGWRDRGRHGLSSALGLLLLAGMLAGCRSLPEDHWPPLTLSGDEIRRELADWRSSEAPGMELHYRGVMEFGSRKIPLLLLGRMKSGERMLALAVLAPTAVKIYEVAGRDGTLQRYELSGFLAGSRPEMVARTLYGDWSAVFLDNHPAVPAALEVGPYSVTFRLPGADGGEVEYVFAGRPLVLARKTARGFWGRRWQVDYGMDGWQRDQNGDWRVVGAEYENFRTGYRERIRSERMDQDGGGLDHQPGGPGVPDQRRDDSGRTR